MPAFLFPSTRARLMATMLAMLLAAVPLQAGGDGLSAREAIAAAVAERMGPGVSVEVVAVDLPAGAPERFVDAMPDPGGRLGRAIRFSLVPASGSRVLVTATLRVVADHVVVRRELARGVTVTDEDVDVVRAEVERVPLRRLPAGEQVIGARVLRLLPAGTVVLPGAVVARRAVEAGDRITAVAVAGAVEVTAELTAADGGDRGDVIRIVNTDTRRSLKGRVIGEGLVEVGHGR